MTEKGIELLLEMDAEAAKHLCLETPMPREVPPQNSSYESVFRVNGQRILPPLMTAAKRIEMIKFKETALKRELSKNKWAISRESRTKNIACDDCEVNVKKTLMQSIKGNIAVDTEEVSVNKFYDKQNGQLYKKFSITNSGNGAAGRLFADSSTCTDDETVAFLAYKPIQRLQRSETIIYDNCSNSIIIPRGTVYEMRKRTQAVLLSERTSQDCTSLSYGAYKVLGMQELGSKANEVASPQSRETTAQLGLPMLCINPPKPFDDLNENHVRHVHLTTDNNEQLNCSGQRVHIENESKNIPERTNFDGNAKSSSTSPLLEIGTNTEALMHNRSVNSFVPSKSDSNLMRSNSFTLERPSQVLIEHMERVQLHIEGIGGEKELKESPMRQPQKLTKLHMSETKQGNLQKKQEKKISSPTQVKLVRSYSSGLRRDTVESKAKRVNKIEVKRRMAPAHNVKKTKIRLSATLPANVTVVSHLAAATNTSPKWNSSRRPNVHHCAHSASDKHAYADVCSRPLTACGQSKNKQQQEVQHVAKLKTQKFEPKTMKTSFSTPVSRLSPTNHCVFAHKQKQHQQPQFQKPLLSPKSCLSEQQEKPVDELQKRKSLSLCPQMQMQLRLQQLGEQNAHQLSNIENASNKTNTCVTFSPNKIRNQETIKNIELSHRKKFMDLISQQHDEQRRLQAQFDMQQKLLLDQISIELESSAILATPILATHIASKLPTTKALQLPSKSNRSASEQCSTESDDDDEDVYTNQPKILDNPNIDCQKSPNTSTSSQGSSVSSIIELSERQLNALSPATARNATTTNSVLTTTSSATSVMTINTARSIASDASSISGGPASMGVSDVDLVSDAVPTTLAAAAAAALRESVFLPNRIIRAAAK